MNIDLAALPADVETLQHMVRALASERASFTEAQAEIEQLLLIIRKLQRSQFGRRAEQLDNDQLQLGLDDINAIWRERRAGSKQRRPHRGHESSGQVCRSI